MMFIGLDSWPSATAQMLGGGSVFSWFGPVLREPAIDLLAAQPLLGIDLQAGRDIVRGQCVPCDCGVDDVSCRFGGPRRAFGCAHVSSFAGWVANS